MKTTGLRKINKIFRSFMILVIGLTIITGASCYRDYGLTTADYDMVLTVFDENNDFTRYTTYAMPDTIIHPVPDGQTDDLPRTFDSQIISDVVRNMNDLGFQRITDTTQIGQTDVIILLSAYKQEWVVSGGYYPGGWWGWYPWYPGGGWYPWYPGYGYSYSYTTGTIAITMVDREKYDPNAQLNSTVWNAGINGLTGDNRASTSSRIRNAINQAFSQSSQYLRRP